MSNAGYDENAVAVNACIMIKSINNYVVNNVFDVSFAKHGAADIAPYVCPGHRSTFSHNIIFSQSTGTLHEDGSWTADGDGARTMLFFDDRANSTDTSAFDSLVEMNHNLYFNARGAAQIRVNEKLLSPEEWKVCEENRHRYDADSICADPLFLDAANHDYRLAEDSPAGRMRIQSIDTRQIGLLD